jgi:hypothetical protein
MSECAIEQIPDGDSVSRYVMTFMMTNGSLDPYQFFMFPRGEPESVVWRKYARTDFDVHSVACSSTARARYLGFRSATKAAIVSLKTRNGHGLDVLHDPPEGRYHAVVQFKPVPGHQMNKTDRSELKEYLAKTFQGYRPHNCT